jgi:hypothetical protein
MFNFNYAECKAKAFTLRGCRHILAEESDTQIYGPAEKKKRKVVKTKKPEKNGRYFGTAAQPGRSRVL